MIKRLPALLACAAAACAAPLPPPTQPTLGPGADTRAWIYNADPAQAGLVYGTPQSDDVAVMFACRPASGRVTVSQGGLRAGEGIGLASGGRRITLHGPVEPDELNGGVFVSAETEVEGPVLQAFSQTGRISTREQGRWSELTSTPEEHAGVRAFLRSCAAERPGPAPRFTPPGWRFMYPLEMVSYSADAAGRMDLLVDCDAGSVRLFRFPPPRTTTDRTSLTVASGAVRTVLRADFNEGHPTSPTGEVFRDPAAAQPELGATLAADSPVMREFLRTGRLSVANSGRTLDVSADAAELAEMRRYFARCERPKP